MMNKVLLSNRKVVDKLTEISIQDKAIDKFVKSLLEKKLTTSELHLFKNEWNLSDYFKLTLILNSMNFCYWAEKGKPKWSMKFDGEDVDGFKAFVKLFENLAIENKQILDWDYLSKLEIEEFEEFFSGSNVRIPLFKERYSNLIVLSTNICDNYDSNSDNLLEASQFKADLLLEKLTEMTCFEDQSMFAGEVVYFWKRAQLQVKMLDDYYFETRGEHLKNIDYLTAIADYKVPQLLRHLGILEYSDKLSTLVDNYLLIEKDSDLENQIRVSMILAIEKIKKKADSHGLKLNASDIDNLIWNKATQNKGKMRPYHRTYTTAY